MTREEQEKTDKSALAAELGISETVAKKRRQGLHRPNLVPRRVPYKQIKFTLFYRRCPPLSLVTASSRLPGGR